MDTKLVKKLREETGAAINDCLKALAESDGDMERAKTILRKKGAVKAAKKKAERSTQAGIIESYLHSNGQLGVLVVVSCETDFVARNPEFKKMAHELAMQIAAANPTYLSVEQVPAEIINSQREIFKQELKAEGKPQNLWEKILAGRLEKFYQEVCLLKQVSIHDESKTVEDLINEKIATFGEKIEVKEFCRLEV